MSSKSNGKKRVRNDDVSDVWRYDVHSDNRNDDNESDGRSIRIVSYDIVLHNQNRRVFYTIGAAR